MNREKPNIPFSDQWVLKPAWVRAGSPVPGFHPGLWGSNVFRIGKAARFCRTLAHGMLQPSGKPAILGIPPLRRPAWGGRWRSVGLPSQTLTTLAAGLRGFALPL